MIMKNVLIIAEAGVNHNGNINLAKSLVEKAAEAGADYIKFQTFKAERNISKFAPKADYQIRNDGNTETQLEMVKKLELNEQAHAELIEHCRTCKVKFLSTPFDFESIDLLKKLGITIGKIPSGEITNLPYLQKMASVFPDIILSTGMSDMNEIREAVNILLFNGAKKERITILHCNTEYPTPMEDVNLLAMLQIQTELGTAIGYSDHTQGIEVPIAAVALGASVIEKHFTMDRNLQGPDHKASLEPNELMAMVTSIRNIEKALGTSSKKTSLSEIANKKIARKSIVAKTKIAKGQFFTEENIIAKRPGTGISPMKWYEVIGQKAKRDFSEDELIEL